MTLNPGDVVTVDSPGVNGIKRRPLDPPSPSASRQLYLQEKLVKIDI
jgi:hypothetical protein